MNLLLGGILVAVAALYVALPFFRTDTDETEPEAPPVLPADRLELQKRDAYAAIKEAEFDHQMGKLSDSDFQTLTEKYRAHALAAIAAMDTGPPAESATHRSPTRIAFCATCGRKLPPKPNFCPGCGRAIKADRAVLEKAPAAPIGVVVGTG
jgi:hypothetical protein